MLLLNQSEQRQVTELTGKAITNLCNALAIITKAEERVVNGSINVTIQYQIRDAISKANEAVIYMRENVDNK